MSSSRTGRLLPQPPKSKLPYKTPLTNLRPHYLKPPNYYLGLMVFKYMCVSVWVCLCKSVLPVLTFLRGIGMNICLFTHLYLYACLCVSKCLHCVCVFVCQGPCKRRWGISGEWCGRRIRPLSSWLQTLWKWEGWVYHPSSSKNVCIRSK